MPVSQSARENRRTSNSAPSCALNEIGEHAVFLLFVDLSCEIHEIEFARTKEGMSVELDVSAAW